MFCDVRVLATAPTVATTAAVEPSAATGESAAAISATCERVGVSTVASRVANRMTIASTVAVDESAAVDVAGRVKAEAKGIPEEAVAGKPGVAEGIAGPHPSGSVAVATVAGVGLSQIEVGVAEVPRAEVAPGVEIVVGLGLLCIELLRAGVVAVESELTIFFHS